MDIAMLVKCMFEVDAVKVHDASEIDESTESPELLVREAAAGILEDEDDAPNYVVEAEGAFIVVGEKQAVMVSDDGSVDVKEITDDAREAATKDEDDDDEDLDEAAFKNYYAAVVVATPGITEEAARAVFDANIEVMRERFAEADLDDDDLDEDDEPVVTAADVVVTFPKTSARDFLRLVNRCDLPESTSLATGDDTISAVIPEHVAQAMSVFFEADYERLPSIKEEVIARFVQEQMAGKGVLKRSAVEEACELPWVTRKMFTGVWKDMLDEELIEGHGKNTFEWKKAMSLNEALLPKKAPAAPKLPYNVGPGSADTKRPSFLQIPHGPKVKKPLQSSEAGDYINSLAEFLGEHVSTIVTHKAGVTNLRLFERAMDSGDLDLALDAAHAIAEMAELELPTLDERKRRKMKGQQKAKMLRSRKSQTGAEKKKNKARRKSYKKNRKRISRLRKRVTSSDEQQFELVECPDEEVIAELIALLGEAEMDFEIDEQSRLVLTVEVADEVFAFLEEDDDLDEGGDGQPHSCSTCANKSTSSTGSSCSKSPAVLKKYGTDQMEKWLKDSLVKNTCSYYKNLAEGGGSDFSLTSFEDIVEAEMLDTDELAEMALTAKSRKGLPDTAFAGPDRSYPVQDKEHVMAAIAYAKKYKNEDAKAAWPKIVKAAKKFGIDAGKLGEVMDEAGKKYGVLTKDVETVKSHSGTIKKGTRVEVVQKVPVGADGRYKVRLPNKKVTHLKPDEIQLESIDEATSKDAEKLLKKGIAQAKKRGHTMGRTTKAGLDSAYSRCTKCDMQVVANAKPAPNETKLMGRALAMECPGTKEDVDEGMTADDKKGLLKWASDYKTVKKAGNDKMAAAIKSNIDARLKKIKLPRKKAYKLLGMVESLDEDCSPEALMRVKNAVDKTGRADEGLKWIKPGTKDAYVDYVKKVNAFRKKAKKPTLKKEDEKLQGMFNTRYDPKVAAGQFESTDIDMLDLSLSEEDLEEGQEHACSSCGLFNTKDTCQSAAAVAKKHGAKKLDLWTGNSMQNNGCSFFASHNRQSESLDEGLIPTPKSKHPKPPVATGHVKGCKKLGEDLATLVRNYYGVEEGDEIDMDEQAYPMLAVVTVAARFVAENEENQIAGAEVVALAIEELEGLEGVAETERLITELRDLLPESGDEPEDDLDEDDDDELDEDQDDPKTTTFTRPVSEAKSLTALAIRCGAGPDAAVEVKDEQVSITVNEDVAAQMKELLTD